MSVRKVILCEDKHGGAFFKELASLLKSKNLMPRSSGVDVTKFYGPCNVKLERQLKAKMLRRAYNFIIVVDADGRNVGRVRNKVLEHVPPSFIGITCVVVLDYEIEDWICVSLGIRFNYKPSVALKQKLGYQKHNLKRYVPKLDIAKLMKCRSFCDFINCF
jgi:hypothetical protein